MLPLNGVHNPERIVTAFLFGRPKNLIVSIITEIKLRANKITSLPILLTAAMLSSSQLLN